jgi:aminopeptidase N
MKFRRPLSFLFLTAALSACSIFGVHFKIHNPDRAGKYPQKSEERLLLGNQDSKYRTCYDVRHYKLHVIFGSDLEKDESISGLVFITAVALSDIDTLQIDLGESLKIIAMDVTDFVPFRPQIDSGPVLEDIHPANYYRCATAVFVVMPKRVAKGHTFRIGIEYSGTPAEAKRAPWSGGFVRKHDDLKAPWLGVACESEGAGSWWPCKDVVNDEPDSVDTYFTVPIGFTAVGNGQLMRVAAGNPWKIMKDAVKQQTFHWHVSYPINTYNITFYVGNYKLLHDTYYSEVTHDTLQLNHYVLSQHYEKAQMHFVQLKEHIAFYEKTFGPFPWYRDGFKLVESPYAGMEHQTAIAYGNGFKNDPRWGFDYIILHETAHEWWGNSVTATDLADAWIHEGFATYCEALFVEYKFGHEKYISYLLNQRAYIVNRRPVSGPYGMRYFNYKDSDIYMKGTWLLHSLRYAVNNDSLFFDILKSFYARYKYKNAGSADFENLVNEKTGEDYKWFFDQYLRNRFTPELEVYVEGRVAYYKWKKTSPGFKMPVKIISVADSSSQLLMPSENLQKTDVTINGAGNVYLNEDQFLYKVIWNKKLPKARK